MMGTGVNWDWKEYFIFLNVLRESGVTNMFGAVPYLVEHCEIEQGLAMNVLVHWMENYAEILEGLE